METISIILFALNLFATCDLSKRLYEFEVEFRYGTYESSDYFPDDPRGKPDREWWNPCKFGSFVVDR